MGLFSGVKKVAKGASGFAGGFLGFGGADAAGDAADAQQKYLQRGIDALNSAYADQKNLLNPQMVWGMKGLDAYGNLLGLGDKPADYSVFRNQPGYQFAQDEGERALGRAQAARGSYFSGGAGRELMKFNSGLADQAYQSYMNRLGSFANLGPQTANALAGYRGQQGQGTANLLSGIGDARASGYVGAANSYGGAVANLLNFGSSILGGGGGGYNVGGSPASAYNPSNFNIGGSAGFSPGMFGF